MSRQTRETMETTIYLHSVRYTHQKFIISVLIKKTTCDIYEGHGHQGYNCGTKTCIDNAVKSIPGVRKCWWDIKLAKKHIPNNPSPQKGKGEYMIN